LEASWARTLDLRARLGRSKVVRQRPSETAAILQRGRSQHAHGLREPVGPSGKSGSLALSVTNQRIRGITWPILSRLDSIHGGFFLSLLKLLAAPAGSRLDHFVLNVDCLTVFLETTASTASCPLCGSHARRVHSRYTRRLADLPCFGRAVQLHLAVRRFFCLELRGRKRDRSNIGGRKRDRSNIAKSGDFSACPYCQYRTCPAFPLLRSFSTWREKELGRGPELLRILLPLTRESLMKR